jgi:hypothetical protein
LKNELSYSNIPILNDDIKKHPKIKYINRALDRHLPKKDTQNKIVYLSGQAKDRIKSEVR